MEIWISCGWLEVGKSSNYMYVISKADFVHVSGWSYASKMWNFQHNEILPSLQCFHIWGTSACQDNNNEKVAVIFATDSNREVSKATCAYTCPSI